MHGRPGVALDQPSHLCKRAVGLLQVGLIFLEIGEVEIALGEQMLDPELVDS